MRRRLAPLALCLALSVLAPSARADEAPPAAVPAAPQEKPLTPQPFPLVTLDSSSEQTLVERRANRVAGWQLTLPPGYVSTEQWEPVCVAPCQARLDANGVYRIGGGVAPSSQFMLPRGPEEMRLHVHAGSLFFHDVGIVLTVSGAAFLLLGSIVAGNAQALQNEAKGTAAGLALAAPGLITMAVGGLLWVLNYSSVKTDDGRSL